jgi:hypothetical protein
MPEVSVKMTRLDAVISVYRRSSAAIDVWSFNTLCGLQATAVAIEVSYLIAFLHSQPQEIHA